MKVEDEDGSTTLVFTSGRREYANLGLVSIAAGEAEEGDPVHEGYDGNVDFGKGSKGALTPAECTELADHMIAKWREWKRARGTR